MTTTLFRCLSDAERTHSDELFESPEAPLQGKWHVTPDAAISSHSDPRTKLDWRHYIIEIQLREEQMNDVRMRYYVDAISIDKSYYKFDSSSGIKMKDVKREYLSEQFTYHCDEATLAQQLASNSSVQACLSGRKAFPNGKCNTCDKADIKVWLESRSEISNEAHCLTCWVDWLSNQHSEEVFQRATKRHRSQ